MSLDHISCNVGDPGSIHGLGRSPGEGNRKTTPVFLPGEFHWQNSLPGYNPWGRRAVHSWVTNIRFLSNTEIYLNVKECSYIYIYIYHWATLNYMVMNILCANNSCIISPNEPFVSKCHLLLLIGVIWINNNNNKTVALHCAQSRLFFSFPLILLLST